jgi:hypothetical protein
MSQKEAPAPSEAEEDASTPASAEAFSLVDALLLLDPGLVSRSMARRVIMSGRIAVDSKIVIDVSYSVRKGQVVEISRRTRRRSAHGRFADEGGDANS